MKHVEVALSICTLDEQLKQKLEQYSSSIEERISTLKELKRNGIKTILFIAPIIPMLADFKEIIERTKDFVDEYWFDALTLRSSFKTKMFKFIDEEYSQYKSIYDVIYNKKDMSYFNKLSDEINEYCKQSFFSYENFFAGTKIAS